MRSGHGAPQGSSGRNEPEAQENLVYQQILPDETEEVVQDAQVLPIHFNYNFMERDKIPLHNEKFSRQVADQQRQTDVITKGFFDNSLPVPSHVVLNHINSWETMASLDVSNRSPEEMSTASQRINQESDAGITEGPTAASM